MTARIKFRIGQAVRMSQLAIDANIGPSKHRLTKRGDTGIVVGFGRQDHLVRVVPDGTKTVGSYHMDFWEPKA